MIGWLFKKVCKHKVRFKLTERLTFVVQNLYGVKNIQLEK